MREFESKAFHRKLTVLLSVLQSICSRQCYKENIPSLHDSYVSGMVARHYVHTASTGINTEKTFRIVSRAMHDGAGSAVVLLFETNSVCPSCKALKVHVSASTSKEYPNACLYSAITCIN